MPQTIALRIEHIKRVCEKPIAGRIPNNFMTLRVVLNLILRRRGMLLGFVENFAHLLPVIDSAAFTCQTRNIRFENRTCLIERR